MCVQMPSAIRAALIVSVAILASVAGLTQSAHAQPYIGHSNSGYIVNSYTADFGAYGGLSTFHSGVSIANGLTVTSGGASITGTENLLGQTDFGTSNTTFIGANGTFSANHGGTTIDGSTGRIASNAQAAFDGGATFGTGPGQSNFDGSGNLTVAGTHTNGNAVVTGYTSTGSLSVTNDATVGGNLTAGTGGNQTTLFQNGNVTVGNVLTVNNGIQANGAVQVGQPSSGITLSTDGSSTFNSGIFVPSAPGGAPAAGGTTINNAGITIVDSRTYISSATGTIIVNATASNTASSKSTVLNGANGNVNVGGAFAVNNSGVNVDMGGNVVHDVATPVLGADAANKAYVDSGLAAANQRIDKANQGVAIAMAVQNPVLTGSDKFGVAVNWGDFAGNNALGATAVGIVGRNVFGMGEKFGVTGGLGASSNQVAGRVGMQFTW